MSGIKLNSDEKRQLLSFLNSHSKPELIPTYLDFIANKYKIAPVVFLKQKRIYLSLESAIQKLEEQGALWRETEIIIGSDRRAVNEHTKKIYICPFTGKIFGDNTHPNPQDAIYDWVSNCPENTERSGGLRVKRFFVSEDPEVIAHYREKQTANKTITRVVYSSEISGKLFNSKEAIIEEFKRKYLKPITLFEVQNQNKYTIDDELLEFLQNHLHEEGVRDFVRALSEDPKFNVFIPLWLESDEEDDDDEEEAETETELVEEDQGE